MSRNKKDSYFHCEAFSILQKHNVAKITTDAFLLGRLIPCLPFKKVLEIGSGTGFVSLIIADRFKDVHIIAIDINQQASELTRQNFEDSPYADRLHAIHVAFQDYEVQDGLFDLIICNPPYFQNSTLSGIKEKDQARHQISFDFHDFFEFTQNKLSPNGILWIITPFLELENMLAKLSKNLFLKERINVFDKTDASVPSLVLLGFSKNRIEPYKENHFILKDNSGKYTQAYRSIAQTYINVK